MVSDTQKLTVSKRHRPHASNPKPSKLSLTVLVATIDAQWEGMRDVGSARYEPALLPPCPTIRVLSYSNEYIFRNSALDNMTQVN